MAMDVVIQVLEVLGVLVVEQVIVAVASVLPINFAVVLV